MQKETFKEKQLRVYNNVTMLKALELVDESKAIEAISNPLLDGKELAEILEASMMGRLINKDTKEPLKLSNAIMSAGLLNKLNQIERDSQIEHK